VQLGAIADGLFIPSPAESVRPSASIDAAFNLLAGYESSIRAFRLRKDLRLGLIKTRDLALCCDEKLDSSEGWARKQIDGEKATSENIIKLLLGPDTPGSIVTIKFMRSIHEMSCSLRRESTSELADKKRMFDLL
jgi:hypothetical protein